jgi:ABC-2 type transport system ATP-binding protein
MRTEHQTNRSDQPLAIKVRGLYKNFGKVKALNDLDLDVPQGSALGFIGPNGAGKTTLIKVMLGIVQPEKGSVEILGAPPNRASIRKHVGYLPERLVLPRHLTPISFLKQIARLKGVPANQIHAEVPHRLNQVGLESAAWSRLCVGFSKGMRQRTGLAAALIGDPKLLILDEPTDGIDPIGRSQIRDIILDCTRSGTTVFLNSHLLNETERICDRIALIYEGQLRLNGTLDDLRCGDQFSVRFKPHERLNDIVMAAGFVSEEAASGIPEHFSFAGNDAAALSTALLEVLKDGIIVHEVVPKLKDLEMVLRETIAAAESP